MDVEKELVKIIMYLKATGTDRAEALTLFDNVWLGTEVEVEVPDKSKH